MASERSGTAGLYRILRGAGTRFAKWQVTVRQRAGAADLEDSTMADKNTPNRAANMEKAEGDRWRSDDDAVNPTDAERPGERYDSERGAGISNRPVGEEIENQEALPERGLSQEDERTRSNEDVER
jgi:hypothetical protein